MEALWAETLVEGMESEMVLSLEKESDYMMGFSTVVLLGILKGVVKVLVMDYYLALKMEEKMVELMEKAKELNLGCSLV